MRGKGSLYIYVYTFSLDSYIIKTRFAITTETLSLLLFPTHSFALVSLVLLLYFSLFVRMHVCLYIQIYIHTLAILSSLCYSLLSCCLAFTSSACGPSSRWASKVFLNRSTAEKSHSAGPHLLLYYIQNPTHNRSLIQNT